MPTVPRPGRLPHGSTYRVRYDACRHAWTGSLYVPGGEFGAVSATAAGLLYRLEALYRRSVQRKETA